MTNHPMGDLGDEMKKYYYDPLGYVMFNFPWDTDPAIQQVPLRAPYSERYNSEFGPDVWACEFLDEWGKDIVERGFDGANAVLPIQYATASGHGIGKSVLVAWIIKFIMDTRPFSKGVVTAGTADQLRTKTWAELGKWHYRSLTKDWFNYHAGRGSLSLVHRNPEWKGDWRCDAHTCREENSESFAGLHAANATPFYVFDEGSGVPDKIYEVRDGGTTDGEPMTFDFGNPTRNSGRFHKQCVGSLRHRYKVRCIDSRTVHITNKDRIQQWLEDYGEDSDYFKVRVRGVFPSAGAVQFIPSSDVEAAMDRDLVEDRFAPLVIGVDVARFGPDDTVLYPRRGSDARSWPFRRYNGLDTVQVAGKVIEMVQEFKQLGIKVAAIFVDATGGSIGGGVVDQLYHLGYSPIGVQFGNTAIKADIYRYRSDEMWGNMRDAIHDSLALPRMSAREGLRAKDEGIVAAGGSLALQNQLTQREFGYTLNRNLIHLETKDSMKDRGISSPDIADALALTFAQIVAPGGVVGGVPHTTKAISEYDPFRTLEQEMPY
ncbi:MAG: hypothetical protein V3V96_15435 [Acidiferrobacterales bacterium]